MKCRRKRHVQNYSELSLQNTRPKETLMEKVSKLEGLHQVIRQMTPPQKRMFRLEINKLNKNSYYELIFNFLEAKKNFNKEDFKNFIKLHNIPGANGVIGYLLDKLVLYIYKSKKVTIQQDRLDIVLRDLSERAYAMTGVGLFNYALKTWWKVLKIADKNNKFRHVTEAISMLYYFGQSQKIKAFAFSDGLQLSIYERLKKLGNDETKYRQLKVLACDVYIRSTQKTTPSDWAEIGKLKLLDHLSSSDYQTYYNAKGIYLLYTKGVEAALANYKAYVDLQLKLIDSNNYNYDYLNILDADYNYIICLYWVDPKKFLNEADHFSTLLKKYNKLFSNANKGEYQRIVTKFNLFNNIVQARRLTLEQGYTLATIQQLDLTKELRFTTPYRLMNMILSLHIAYLCVLIKEYKAFYKYQLHIEKLLSGMEHVTNHVYELQALILIELYENNNNSFFKNQLKNFTRKIKKQNDADSTIIMILDLLKKLGQSEEPEILMKNALPTILDMEKRNQKPGRTLPFYIWLQKRILQTEQ